jgi:ABC-type multidrug transport system fused ATPase/permease subunit
VSPIKLFDSSLNKNLKISLSLLDEKNRLRFILIVILNAAISFLDLIGVVLFGFVGLLLSSSTPSNTNNPIFSWLYRQVSFILEISNGILILALSASILLLSKNIISAVIYFRIYRFLGNLQAKISNQVIESFFSQNIIEQQKNSPQEMAFILSTGTFLAITKTLSSAAIIFSEFCLLLIIGIFLLISFPTITIFSFILFLIIGLILQKIVRNKSIFLGNQVGGKLVKAQRNLLQFISTYREIHTYNKVEYFTNKLKVDLGKASTSRSSLMFIDTLPKSFFELGVMTILIVMTSIGFIFSQNSDLDVVLITFLVAGFRLLPSIIRINGGLISIRSATSEAKSFYDFVASHHKIEKLPDEIALSIEAKGRLIELRDVDFRYPDSEQLLFSQMSLKINDRDTVAVVGLNGIGKSTLLDLMMGIYEPTQGHVTIGNIPVGQFIRHNQGSISYVPQKTQLLNTTIRSNVAFGVKASEINDDKIWEVLEISGISNFVQSLPKGLESILSEFGDNLSGGQIQRLGLSRALYVDPEIIFMDEPTNAVDQKSEDDILRLVIEKSKNATIIMVTHNLKNLTFFKKVIFLEAVGKYHFGDIDEVKKKSSTFFDLMKNINKNFII